MGKKNKKNIFGRCFIGRSKYFRYFILILFMIPLSILLMNNLSGTQFFHPTGDFEQADITDLSESLFETTTTTTTTRTTTTTTTTRTNANIPGMTSPAASPPLYAVSPGFDVSIIAIVFLFTISLRKIMKKIRR